jgi:hypothetical protein
VWGIFALQKQSSLGPGGWGRQASGAQQVLNLGRPLYADHCGKQWFLGVAQSHGPLRIVSRTCEL